MHSFAQLCNRNVLSNTNSRGALEGGPLPGAVPPELQHPGHPEGGEGLGVAAPLLPPLADGGHCAVRPALHIHGLSIACVCIAILANSAKFCQILEGSSSQFSDFGFVPYLSTVVCVCSRCVCGHMASHLAISGIISAFVRRSGSTSSRSRPPCGSSRTTAAGS